MDVNKTLAGKRVLIVDDEQDILHVLVELLVVCKIDTASSFEEGKQLLENNTYDIAVLDIMGVKGFDLLKIANEQKVPALMLTAHALSEESLEKAAKDGASYFAPKDKITEIDVFIADVIEAREEEKNVWAKWFDRLGGFFDQKFGGPDWREKDREYWEKRLKRFPGV